MSTFVVAQTTTRQTIWRFCFYSFAFYSLPVYITVLIGSMLFNQIHYNPPMHRTATAARDFLRYAHKRYAAQIKNGILMIIDARSSPIEYLTVLGYVESAAMNPRNTKPTTTSQKLTKIYVSMFISSISH